ncbi:AAA domain-containing protein [Bradymonas sediminis]|nr:AAA domain-containing protein [Bradymonas sediminis]
MNRIGPELHAERPKVVAFGGGKGGAGRSTLCAEVARSLARKNQRVLCLDASWACPTLNVLLHAEEPRFDFHGARLLPIGAEGAHIADFIIPTGGKNIWLANIGAARHFPFVRPRLGADILIAQLHELDFDWILLDLAAGLDPLDVGLFTLSDIPILVGTPEPAAVRTITQYLRSAFYQALGYHPQAPAIREQLLEMLYEQPLNMNLDSLLASARGAQMAEQIVLESGQRFEPYLLINLVREGSERDLSHVLCHAWHRELNIFPRVIASVEYEDRRWFYNRRTSGLGPGRGDESLSRDTEALVKNLFDISLLDARFPRPAPRGENAHPALQLGISRETPKNDLRQYYRRLWESYRREETLALVFGNPEDRVRIADDLERKYREVLTMPNEVFGNDSSGRSPANAPQPRTQPSASGAFSPPRLATSSKPAPPKRRAPAAGSTPPPTPDAKQDASQIDEVGEPTERMGSLAPLGANKQSPGEFVAAMRREANLSLQDLSLRSHIGIKFLTAIEDVDLEVLPRPVYLRGYLREIARILEVDAQPLIDTYFRYLDNQ